MPQICEWKKICNPEQLGKKWIYLIFEMWKWNRVYKIRIVMLEDYRMYVVRLEKMQFTRQITIEGINGGNV